MRPERGKEGKGTSQRPFVAGRAVSSSPEGSPDGGGGRQADDGGGRGSDVGGLAGLKRKHPHPRRLQLRSPISSCIRSSSLQQHWTGGTQIVHNVPPALHCRFASTAYTYRTRNSGAPTRCPKSISLRRHATHRVMRVSQQEGADLGSPVGGGASCGAP